MAMYGSFLGNLLALVFFLSFQLCGLLVSFAVFKNLSLFKKILFASLFGSVMLQWLPTLFSFLLGFNQLSNLLALAFCIAVSIAVSIKFKVKLVFFAKLRKRNALYFVPVILVYFCFALLTFNSFTISNGHVFSSQSTYGDMSMHLGFITSIAQQGSFPPEYSILPGNLLSYPFLSDSISSSLYIFGASLRFAYILPMLFAGAQAMSGFFILFAKFLNSKSKAALTTILFFLFGGFGVVYFLNGAWTAEANFLNIFSGFFTTPTNLIEENIRWVTPIVDLLVPQRTTLFGWAVLFPTLYLLYCAVQNNSKIYFVVSGIFTAGLVMIHTHSFLVMVFFSVAWLFTKFFILLRKENLLAVIIKSSFVVIPVAMTILQVFTKIEDREDSLFLIIALAFIAFFICTGVLILLALIKKKGFSFIKNWGLFIVIAVLGSIGQLLFWTFSQAQGESFVRGLFNWANLQDNYLWFYIKNLGIVALLIIPAVFYLKNKLAIYLSPVVIIWIVSELMVFQPNTYDNNKLLYPAFAFMCAVCVNLVCDFAKKLEYRISTYAVIVVFMFVGTISGFLTIGREFVSEQIVFESSQLKYTAFIEENTEADAVILTNTRHNNAVAALSGRNIVCGSEHYLYFHGLDYLEQEFDIEKIYADPKNNEDLLKKYEIELIIVSEYEKNSYVVDQVAFDELYELVYDDGNAKIYKVGELT